MDAKIPVPLIIGSTPVGRGFLTLFVIEEVQAKMSKFISSSLIVGDIDIKLLEYPNAFNLGGPLSALGSALPGLSQAVATITTAVSGVTGMLNVASTMVGGFGASALGAVTGTTGGILNSLTGAASANSVGALLNSLTPGAVTQVVAPSAAVFNTALANLRAAGH